MGAAERAETTLGASVPVHLDRLELCPSTEQKNEDVRWNILVTWSICMLSFHN